MPRPASETRSDASTSASGPPSGGESGDPRRAQQLQDRFAAALGVPFTTGNRVDVLVNGDEIFPAMLEAIGEARHSIEFLTFVYWTGDVAERFAEAFAKAAERGVRVRILLDAFGAKPMNRSLLEQMKGAGCEVDWFRPLGRWKQWQNDHRTHRKVLICDQNVGFTGGVGIAEEWEGDARDETEWRDTHFRVLGPAVAGIRSAFIGNWVEAGHDLLDDASQDATGRDEDHDGRDEPPGHAAIQTIRSTASIEWSDAFLLQRLAIRESRQRLRITTAYFVPNGITVGLLCEAAGRGVDVHLLFPGPHTDERLCALAGQDVFEPLLEAGVHLHVYQPTMIHAKIITVDGELALLGSANFNARSIQKDDELCLTVIDRELVATLDRQFDHDLERAEAVDLSRWKKRSLWQRSKEVLSKPFRKEL